VKGEGGKEDGMYIKNEPVKKKKKAGQRKRGEQHNNLGE